MIRAYWSERLPVRKMAPLVLLLTAAARAGRPATDGLVADVVLAFLLSAQFRVWDDLADRRRDAIAHPDRVLVRAPSVWPVELLCAVLGITAAIVVSLRGAPAVWLGAAAGGSNSFTNSAKALIKASAAFLRTFTLISRS